MCDYLSLVSFSQGRRAPGAGADLSYCCCVPSMEQHWLIVGWRMGGWWCGQRDGWTDGWMDLDR